MQSMKVVLFGASGMIGRRISAEDYAVALMDELEKPQHVRQRFAVGY
jgi:uncharacterized protein